MWGWERVITIPRLRFFGIFLTDTRLITHAIHVLFIYIYWGKKFKNNKTGANKSTLKNQF